MSTLGRLQHIKLKGFRSIRELDLDLAPLNVLIGANGAGKSNFISFFKFMNKLLDKDLQLYVTQQGGANRLLHFGMKTTESVDIDLHFPPNGYRATLVPTVEDSLVFSRESTLFHGNEYGYQGGTQMNLLGNSGGAESLLPDPGTWVAKPPYYVARYLSDWKVYHFHDTSESAKVKLASNIHDNTRLRPQGENLAAFLYGIRKRSTKAYDDIIGMIQRVAPFFQNFVFQPEPKGQIRLRWKHKGSDEYFDAHMLSDGTLRFICLTTLLLQPNLPTILLLDEPELGLHPFAIQLLAAMMCSASAKTQIIASTQSVTLANEFGWQDIVVVDQVENASRFRRLDEAEVTQWLDDFRMGELWEMNLLGGTPE